VWEKIHQEWGAGSPDQFLKRPENRGNYGMVRLEPTTVLTPPEGKEYGWVPIVLELKQSTVDWAKGVWLYSNKFANPMYQPDLATPGHGMDNNNYNADQWTDPSDVGGTIFGHRDKYVGSVEYTDLDDDWNENTDWRSAGGQPTQAPVEPTDAPTDVPTTPTTSAEPTAAVVFEIALASETVASVESNFASYQRAIAASVDVEPNQVQLAVVIATVIAGRRLSGVVLHVTILVATTQSAVVITAVVSASTFGATLESELLTTEGITTDINVQDVTTVSTAPEDIVCRTDQNVCTVPCDAAQQACCSDFVHSVGMCSKCVQTHCPLAAPTAKNPCGTASCSMLSATCKSSLTPTMTSQQRQSVLCDQSSGTACSQMYACMRQVLTTPGCQGDDSSAAFRRRLESHLDSVESMCSEAGLAGDSPACKNANEDGSCDITETPKL
jgi:hypothetical protein